VRAESEEWREGQARERERERETQRERPSESERARTHKRVAVVGEHVILKHYHIDTIENTFYLQRTHSIILSQFI
jgi:hypothetical protein